MFLPAKRSIARFLLVHPTCNTGKDFVQPILQRVASNCIAPAKSWNSLKSYPI